MIEGYKCFNEGLINQYGIKFEVGKEYHANGDIQFHQNGFHMCQNLEDTLRYFDAINGKVDITKVIGYGQICQYDDEYNGFYDMYAVEYLKIVQVLNHDEVIDYALKLYPERVKRFLSLYKLNSDEIILFKEKFYQDISVLMTIEYYQENNTKVYQKKM